MTSTYGCFARRLLCSLVFIPVLIACGDTTIAAQSSNVEGGDADYSLCDCVNYPPTTDAKNAACSVIIDSMPVEEMVARSSECRKLISVPAGGPDICYCMTFDSDDPEVRQACANIVEDIDSNDLFSITRECAVKRIDESRQRS